MILLVFLNKNFNDPYISKKSILMNRVKGETSDNRLKPNGSTVLHAATSYEHIEIVRLLLQVRG